MLAILCPIYHFVNSIKKLLIIVRAGNVSWTALVVLSLILSLLTLALAFQFKNIIKSLSLNYLSGGECICLYNIT